MVSTIPTFLWLILLPLLAAPVIYIAGRIVHRRGGWWLPWLLALLTQAAGWVLLVHAASLVADGARLAYTLGSITLHMDGLSLILVAVALGLGFFVTLYSGPYLSADTGQEKFFAMLVLMIAAIIGLGCATDIFNLWIWYEAMAVTSYLLVVFYRHQAASLEAGLKYLVQSASGSAIIVIGIALVLAKTGSLELAQIRTLATSSPLLTVAGILIIVGFGVKAALVPLHTWLPDAHSQAPSGISAMLSGVVIEAGLVALLRALGALFPVNVSWPLILIGFAILNMLTGNLMALRQHQVKRLLAYSSVAHMGYMLLGLGITAYSGEALGAQGSFFHLINHALMKGLAFLSAGALLYTLHVRAGDHQPLVIADLAGAARRYPLVALSLSIAVLALGGLPPLAGFMSEWQIFLAGYQTGNILIELTIIFAALNSVLSLAYYAPLINAMYRLKTSPRVTQGSSLPLAMSVPLLVFSLAIILLGIWPALVNDLVVPAGAALQAIFGG